MKVFVRKTVGKKGKPYVCLVVRLASGKELFFFETDDKFMTMLDLKPSDFYQLANGDYEIV